MHGPFTQVSAMKRAVRAGEGMINNRCTNKDALVPFTLSSSPKTALTARVELAVCKRFVPQNDRARPEFTKVGLCSCRARLTD